MNEIVEKKEKSFLKVFLSIIAIAILIDFVIFLANKYTAKYPYVTNIIVIFMVTLACSGILIKYFSKYSYTLEDDELIFHRLIGKRNFKMLSIKLDELSSIKPYSGNEKYNFNYKFVFDKSFENCHVGRYHRKGKEYLFLFRPSQSFVSEVNRKISTN